MPRKAKKARRVQGTGSFFFSERLQKYIGRTIVGRNPDGSPKYVQRSAATVAQLQAKLDRVKPLTAESGVTLAAWLTRWLAESKSKPATRRNRSSMIRNHIIPSLGHLPVATVTARQIEVAASNWKLAATSARNGISVLGTAMRAAVRDNLRPDNPVRAAQKPKGKKKKIDPFTLDEVARIVEEAVRRPYTRAVALIAVTGCRSGEACALDVEDFDSHHETISITKTLDNCDRNVSGTPKSENGVRTIEIPAAPPAALAAIRAAAGKRRTGPLFLTSKGKRMIDHVLAENWRTLLKRLGIRYRGKHQLRHAWASHSLAAGTPAAEVAKYLGDTFETISKTYAHATGSVNAAAAFAGLFRGREGDRKVTAESGKVTNARESRMIPRK